MKKEEIVIKLLNLLENKLNISVKLGDYKYNRQVFRGICNQLPPMDLGRDFYTLQDELLTIEKSEKNIVDVNNLTFNANIAHFTGDITTVKADAIVNAANDNYLGCFVPCHNCIDNVIMSASGFQMRNELSELKKQSDYDKQIVKVTGGYNLPCHYVFHVAGPIIYGEVSNKDILDLKNCYISCLDRAKTMELKNIVFCCISTGEYHFPNELACEIAIETVKNWLQKNNYCLKVVFNTFKEIDKELYDERLWWENFEI